MKLSALNAVKSFQETLNSAQTAGLKMENPSKRAHDEVDKLIREAKDTGKGLLKEADALLKRFR